MLSISNPGKGSAAAAYYFKYYSTECLEPGEWFGDGAEILGLRGQVDRATFINLMKGKYPDGHTDLVQNAGSEKRASHWDLTFSAPKSVSVLYAFGTERVQKEIIEAHKYAVDVALRFMQAQAAQTRRGPGGKVIEPCALVGSSFVHVVSRAHDPQIHTHAIVENAGIRQDGSTGSLHSIEFFRNKMTCGALYQAELAHQLTKRLGVGIEKERVGFHVKGVSKEVCEDFSQRRKQVEAALKKHGKEGPVASKVAAETTRDKKKPMEKELLLSLA